MSMTLRIYFVGMIAFIPGIGQDLSILLIDLRDGYYVSDGTYIEPHKPLLLARADHCHGDCTDDQGSIAEFLYRFMGEGHGDPVGNLQKAIHEGGAWELADSDLAIESTGLSARGVNRNLQILWGSETQKAPVPQNAEESGQFNWVADLRQIDPSAAAVDPDVLEARPKKGLIVARLRLDQGRVRTHRLVSINDEVPQIEFRTLRDRVKKSSYTQALADWVVAEIPLQGCELKLTDTSLKDGEQQRAMELSIPSCEDGSVIEMAILNVPQASFMPTKPSSEVTFEERIGRHFEIYYELSNNRPPNRLRSVPFLGEGVGIGASEVHDSDPSDFLSSIVIEPGRGFIVPQLCPVGLLSTH